jgi:hypothetical protein
MTSPKTFAVLNIINTDQVPKRRLVTNVHEFITRAREIHGVKYDYSKVIYIKSIKKVIIICRLHGEFTQTPNAHLSGSGCRTCRDIGNAPNRNEYYIQRAREIHGDRYDYTKIVVITSHSKVIIICHIHGEFIQEMSVHLSGYGCQKCGSLANGDKHRWTREEFIERSIAVHGNKYSYDNVVYDTCKVHVHIDCPIHGPFYKRPSDHVQGQGCPKCGITAMALGKRLTMEQFLQKAHEMHGDTYDYSKVVYTVSSEHVCIICRLHGEFMQKAQYHIHDGKGCPMCRASHGERAILKLFAEWQFPVLSQFKLPGSERRYDFQVAYFLIEFDGFQHFEMTHFHKSYEHFLYRQRVDLEKTLAAFNAGYCLIRIDHTQEGNITNHLQQALSQPQRLYLSTPDMYRYITDTPELRDLIPQLTAKITFPTL